MKGKKTIILLLAAVLFSFCGITYGNSLSPLADGYVQYVIHENSYKVVDYYWTAILNNDGFGECRGIVEFDISSVGQPLESATLTIWQLDRFNHSGGVNLYAYQGDGQITRSDFNRTATFVTSMVFPAGYNYGYGVPFDTDVLSALQQAHAEGWDYLGLRLESAYSSGDVHYATQGTSDWPYLGGQPPSIAYQVIPEPLTILGMFLGVGGLAGYIRRRCR